MARRIPPLNPLRVFEIVARTGNLTTAAEQLHVTQSAVSRQITTLEEYLGVRLFTRERYGVSLTAVGRSYAGRILPAFESIADATEKLTKGAQQGALRVRTYTTFATKWLIPRLGHFRERYPDFEIRLSTAVPDVNFDLDPVDLAIQFGNGNWPNVQAELLFRDEIEPVCSPAFLSQFAPNPKYPESLLRQRLLVSRYRRTDWDEWLKATGYDEQTKDSQRMSFGSTFLTWQAAADGQGIAMGQTALLTTELETRQLVRPFSKPLRRESGYYLVKPKPQRESRKVNVFLDWLMEECAPIAAAQQG